MVFKLSNLLPPHSAVYFFTVCKHHSYKSARNSLLPDAMRLLITAHQNSRAICVSTLAWNVALCDTYRDGRRGQLAGSLQTHNFAKKYAIFLSFEWGPFFGHVTCHSTIAESTSELWRTRVSCFSPCFGSVFLRRLQPTTPKNQISNCSDDFSPLQRLIKVTKVALFHGIVRRGSIHTQNFKVFKIALESIASVTTPGLQLVRRDLYVCTWF